MEVISIIGIWLLGFLIGLFIEIFFLKFSAEQAYKIKTSYSRAFVQWLWLFILRIILSVFLFFLLYPILSIG